MKETGIIFNSDMVRATLSGEKTQTRRIMKIQPPKRENFPGSSFGLCRAVHPDSKMFSLNQYDRLPKHPTDWDLDGSVGVARNAGFPMTYRCPFGQVGDRLWVRETWQVIHDYTDEYGNVDERRFARSIPKQRGNYWHPVYAERFGSENRDDRGFPWRPAIHMPRWASRITLEITDVRVERLNDISEEDAIAEGVARRHSDTYHGFYRDYENQGYGCGCTFAKDSFRSLWRSIYGAESWSANPWCWTITFKRIEGD